MLFVFCVCVFGGVVVCCGCDVGIVDWCVCVVCVFV